MIRFELNADIEAINEDDAQARLDRFREITLPNEYGISLYRTRLGLPEPGALAVTLAQQAAVLDLLVGILDGEDDWSSDTLGEIADTLFLYGLAESDGNGFLRRPKP